jgi:pyruvate dehydrogenase E1 component alpha subunit
MLGNLCPVTVGAALAFKRRGEQRVALTFLGEGAFSVGDVHEGLNLAGVWQVPAVFVLQSNGYSYSTPASAQMVNTNLAERITGGWSIPAVRVDGTDAMLVYETIKAAVERARSGEGPQAVECVTLRGHGHAAHDAALYVPAELRDSFAGRDPIELLERQLAQHDVDEIRRGVTEAIAAGLAEAESAPAPDPAEIERGIYANPV